jgi:putative RNA 2'-phosphotransferase
MNPKRLIHISKFLSKHLRHAPEEIGLTLEPGGWVSVDALLEACRQAGMTFSRSELDQVVAENNKQRFAFDETGLRIRANQGHSVEVDLQLEPTAPPAVLYHGTSKGPHEAILKNGLKKMSRHHVHLSLDVETAFKVGTRHGKPVILLVDAEKMARDGFVFYVSNNGVWLTDRVPPTYIRLLEEEKQ